MTDATTIRPFSKWAQKVNEIVRKNKFTIRGIIPHFYYENKFHYSLIVILNDDFGLMVTKDEVSEVDDLRKLFGISFNANIPDKLGCDDLKVILEQMENANVISKDRYKSILQNYRC